MENNKPSNNAIDDKESAAEIAKSNNNANSQDNLDSEIKKSDTVDVPVYLESTLPFQEELPFSLFWALRRVAVFLICTIVFYLCTCFDSEPLRTLFALFATFVLLYIPELIYRREQRVVMNDELKIHFKPAGFSQRLIYSFRRHLSQPFIFAATGIILFYGVVCDSVQVISAVILSAVVYLASEFILTMLFHKIDCIRLSPSITRFYRSGICAVFSAIAVFIFALYNFELNVSQKDAFTVLTGAVTTDFQGVLGAVTILKQGLDIVSATQDYILALSRGHSWFMLLKALIVALPFAILAVHISIALSVMTLTKKQALHVLTKQSWVKTDRTLIKRYWKTICLPIFLFCFFGGSFYFIYPYYLKYEDKLILKPIHGIKEDSADVIDDKYYSGDTFKEIESEKVKAENEITEIFHNAENETDVVFASSLNNAAQFSAWFKAVSEKQPFEIGDSRLKQMFASTMNLKSVSIRMNNIRKETGTAVADVFNRLNNKITDILTQNLIQSGVNTDNLKLSKPVSESLVRSMRLPNGKVINLTEEFRLEEKTEDFEMTINEDFDNPHSLWFSDEINTEQKSMEDDLLSALDTSDEKDNESQNENDVNSEDVDNLDDDGNPDDDGTIDSDDEVTDDNDSNSDKSDKDNSQSGKAASVDGSTESDTVNEAAKDNKAAKHDPIEVHINKLFNKEKNKSLAVIADAIGINYN